MKSSFLQKGCFISTLRPAPSASVARKLLLKSLLSFRQVSFLMLIPRAAKEKTEKKQDIKRELCSQASEAEGKQRVTGPVL